jgi:3-mercaptopyruvate sulfurtransferase SseA
VYCACPNEISAAQIANALKLLGFTRVHPLQGGIDAWIAAGNEVSRPTVASMQERGTIQVSGDAAMMK